MVDGYILREDMLEKLNGNLDDFYKASPRWRGERLQGV